MIKKIFTLLLAACLCTIGWAQNNNNTGSVVHAIGTPVIDGEIDAVWSTANKYNIERAFKSDIATVGPIGTSYYKALWDDLGMYIIVVVNDDAWFPSWADGTGKNSYDYDNIETYFDTNYILADGKGGQNPSTSNGHRCIAPATPKEADWGKKLTGKPALTGTSYDYAYKVTPPTYSAEFFVPWTTIPDKDNFLFDKTQTMGFDITVIDRDPGDTSRKRVNWSNNGAVDENWNYMDDAGRLTFEGAPRIVYVNNIYIAAGQKITVDNGMLTIAKTIIPADASYPQLTWSIVAGGTGIATIDAETGILKAFKDGTVLVKATATDGGFAESDPTEIIISGQWYRWGDIYEAINLIKNWNFDQGMNTGNPPLPKNWDTGWVDKSENLGLKDQKEATIVEGAAACVGKKSTDNYPFHYQFCQNNLGCEPERRYLLRFKAWADADGSLANVRFEDDNNNYERYGASSDASAIGGRADWDFTANVVPAWYEFHISAFDKIVADTQQQIQFNFSGANATFYLDSVLLIVDPVVTSQQMKAASFKVYPNPVGNAGELTVSLAEAKGSVAIYNSIGQKMMEKVATSTSVKFNVTSLRKGLYIVKLGDGTTQKFIR